MQHYLDFLLLLPLFHLIKSGHEYLVSIRHERGDLEDSNKCLFGATSPTETFKEKKCCSSYVLGLVVG